MCLLAFSSKFVEMIVLLKMTNIPFVWYLFLSCCLLLLNKLNSNFLAQKAPRKVDQETCWSVCNCILHEECEEFSLSLSWGVTSSGHYCTCYNHLAMPVARGSFSGAIMSHLWTYMDIFSGMLGKLRTWGFVCLFIFLKAYTLGILVLITVFLWKTWQLGPQTLNQII